MKRLEEIKKNLSEEEYQELTEKIKFCPYVNFENNVKICSKTVPLDINCKALIESNRCSTITQFMSHRK